MILMVVLVVAASAILVSSLSSATIQAERDKTTSLALVQAKDALIAYAATYADTHSGSNVNGFLPCPDQGQAITDGSANSICGSKNANALGKFPWKTLGLTPLKDANGDCLLYAVSGTFKISPDTDFMNWDNNGLFQLKAQDATNYLAGGSPADQPAAIIFSPGSPFNSQSRTNDPAKAPVCGGNYTYANYLDNDTLHSINNANTNFTANTVHQYISGAVYDASGNLLVNDRMITISRKEIFDVIKKRSDFKSTVDNVILANAFQCIYKKLTNLAYAPNTLYLPVTINFDSMVETGGTTVGTGMNQLIVGRIPKNSALSLPKPAECNEINLAKWRDNIAYAACALGTQCLSVNTVNCRGLLIFSGESGASQVRNTNTDRNNWTNYLEGSALSIFSSGASSVTGMPTAYTAAAPSTDIWTCIP